MEWWEKQNKWFDCFSVLKIDEFASEKEIKHAYRELVKKYHPDINSNTEEQFRKITLAYETLSDKEKREKYIAFSKLYKKNNQRSGQEQSLNFKDVVKEYKEKEKQIRIFINLMISKVEKKKEQFASVYNEFCNALKSGNLKESDFEVRKQKLRSVEESSKKSINEIEEIINVHLKSVDLTCEKKKLRKLLFEFTKTEYILNSSYKQALIKLKISTIRFKKPYVAIVPISIILVGIYLSNIENKEKNLNNEENLVAEIDFDEQTNISESISNQDIVTEGPQTDCILFQEVPENMEYDEISNPYKMGPYEVVSARKDGIGYILDTGNNNVIISNYISHGPPLYKDRKRVYVFSSIDGYTYTLDASDLRTILEVESYYSEESEPFYLDGYGYVIEAMKNGKKYLIDAETRYQLVIWFDDYSELYYDERFGCDVYCFTKYNGSKKYYVQADNLTKVLKIESVYE